MSSPLGTYRPFSPADIQQTRRRAEPLLAPWRWLTRPLLQGLEHLPDRPVMLVGNHTLLGFLDAPLMMLELHRKTGLFPRGLGDHDHFRLPGWGHFWDTMGIVDGTRDTCARMMTAGETLVVFPGGAREGFKNRHQRYQLLWQGRLGFARMALAHGYPIVPFAAVGADECYRILWDRQDWMKSPLGPLVRILGLREETLPQLLAGIGPTPMPMPQRLYFRLGPVIEPGEFGTDGADTAACQRLQERVKGAVEAELQSLFRVRQNDPRRDLLPRLSDAVQGFYR